MARGPLVCFCSNQIKISDVPKWEELFPNVVCYRTGYTKVQKKLLILNLNNFLSRHFKKILNSQKLDNLFIFKLPKFGGDWSESVIHFFRFLRALQNDKMMPEQVSSY